MPSVIYCGTNCFTATQAVHIIQENKEEIIYVKTKELPNIIAELCETRDIIDVKLSGSLTYNKKISRDIETCYSARYNTNKKLNVEVIK